MYIRIWRWNPIWRWERVLQISNILDKSSFVSSQRVQDSFRAVNRSLLKFDDTFHALYSKIDQKSNDSAHSIKLVDSKCMNLTGKMEDSLRRVISIQFGEIERLSENTNDIGRGQEHFERKLSNLVRRNRLSSRFLILIRIIINEFASCADTPIRLRFHGFIWQDQPPRTRSNGEILISFWTNKASSQHL